jgi:V-type H+-transporting ATPase subunit a
MQAFQANRYAFPEEKSRQHQMKAEVMERLREIKTTLDASLDYRNDSLQTIANQLQDWFVVVQREKAIHHSLNMFSVDVARQCFIAEAWAPTSAIDSIQDALSKGQKRANSQVSTIIQPKPTKEMPPTYFETDTVTSSFQNIIESYGTANYKEANPALFSIVTFPFLFAVMFGDFGHGIIMFITALYMVLNEKKLKKPAQENEIFGMMYGGRYVILLMAVFSIYVGALYNECMALPMKLFGDSVYKDEPCEDGIVHKREVPCSEDRPPELESWNSKTYPFGVDPMWLESENSLTFLNSLKMKASIILGVCQMTLGLFHNLLNHLYFKDYLGVYFEFIPQVLLLHCMFGYLSLLIVLKWVAERGGQGATADLYGVMINMFLSPGSVSESNRLFTGQAGLQVFLLLIMFVSVPTMLLVKPLVLKFRYDRQLRGYDKVSTGEEPEPDETTKLEAGASEQAEDDKEEEEGFNFGETMVHQMIHTIEFVIGVVSNTASYLRLWALSLAHAQLSKVFYDMVLLTSISTGSVPLMVVGAAVFASATFGVLMVMESLSAFLHCLRLHWVEMMNKHYDGSGKPFKPLKLDQESLLHVE